MITADVRAALAVAVVVVIIIFERYFVTL